MDKECKLMQIAERQQGYFTSRQAEECGYSPSNFKRRINAGKWCKEEVKGIYRIAHFPTTSRNELTLWMLWSSDKYGNPQGVWSHETALDIHSLSDVAPAKLHMSVPKGFRRRSEIPKVLCLHFVDEIPQNEIENREGFRVTTPLRTLKDVIQEGTAQIEQIELAILDLAIQKSLIKGLATIQEMEQLKECTESNDLREIIAKSIDEVWARANVELADLGRKIEPYTIGLSLGDRDFGTAVLCRYKSQFFFLTAGHVGRAFRKAKQVGLLVRFDHLRREYPAISSKYFTVKEWDVDFNESTLDDVLVNQPKDLAVIIPPQDVVDTLKIFKDFYSIGDEAASFSLKDALISMGGIEPIYSEDRMTCQLNMGPFAFVASSYQQFSDTDYIRCPVSNNTYEIRNLRRKAVSSFEGISGSGLWKIVSGTPVLVGIAIAQGDPSTGSGDVYFHGPHSILSLLFTLGLEYERN